MKTWVRARDRSTAAPSQFQNHHGAEPAVVGRPSGAPVLLARALSLSFNLPTGPSPRGATRPVWLRPPRGHRTCGAAVKARDANLPRSSDGNADKRADKWWLAEGQQFAKRPSRGGKGSRVSPAGEDGGIDGLLFVPECETARPDVAVRRSKVVRRQSKTGHRGSRPSP
jgi:hypothetical protein